MYKEALTHYSSSLNRDMNMMIYGSSGVPFLVFPTQDGMCRQWEDFGLVDHLGDFIGAWIRWTGRAGLINPVILTGARSGRNSISTTLRTRLSR